MYILRRIAAIIVSASLFATSNAHSTQRNPLTYISRVDNAVVNTPSNRIHAHSKFDLTFDLHGGKERVRLSLTPNHAVIQDGASIQYLGADGLPEKEKKFDRAEYLVYKGQSWVRSRDGEGWTNAGWARIVMHNDGKNPLFEGTFRLNGNQHHVQTRTHFMQTRHQLDPELEKTDEEYLVVWRDSDIGSPLAVDDDGNLHAELKRSTGVSPSCSADSLEFNTQPGHPVFRAMKRDDSFWGSMSTRSILGRQIDGQTYGNSAGINLIEHIGSTDGCSSTRKVALVGIATDCTYTESFTDEESLRRNVINVINAASVQYEDAFNITLGLKSLTIMPKGCPASPQQATPWNVDCNSADIQQRLNLFSAWRGQQQDTNAYWSLLSTCESGSAVGLAWLGQACVQEAQIATSATGVNETVSGANVVVRTSQEWQVFAHETGHTFGAVHDCSAQTCASVNTVNSQQCCPLSARQCDAGGRYIMNPSTGTDIQIFSPCTIGNICTAIGRNSVKTGCLTQNKDVSTITGSQCGNGIVESGEECDCGGESGCGSNSCCDPTTCRFKQGAKCDPSNEDCCTQSCQFASSGTVCRASTGVCDPQETCNGTAAACPADVTAPDGQSCGDSLSCASGQCTSRNLQCKTLMGAFTTQNDTFACSNQGCQISCQSPEFGERVCYSMQQNFLDGTPCQGGGKCSNGICQGASFGKEVVSWIQQNKTLVIALSCVIGGLLILSIVGCCWSRYRRRKRLAAREAARPPPPSWNPTGSGRAQSWQRGSRSNQHYGANGQAYMSPSHSRSQMQPGGGGWGPDGRWNPNMNMPPPVWQPSVRYA